MRARCCVRESRDSREGGARSRKPQRASSVDRGRGLGAQHIHMIADAILARYRGPDSARIRNTASGLVRGSAFRRAWVLGLGLYI